MTIKSFCLLFYFIVFLLNCVTEVYMQTETSITSTLLSYSIISNIIESSEENDSNCISSQTISGRNEYCQGEIIFEENFSTTLKSGIWKHDIRIPLDSKGAEFISYQNYPENCYVEDGKLFIVPTLLTNYSGFTTTSIRNGQLFLSECNGKLSKECERRAGMQVVLPPVVSCKINTRAYFSFKYGKIEIRAKLPKGDWIFPELLLEPVNNEYGSYGYASGQMRIGFIRGNEILFTKDHENINGKQLLGGLILSRDQKLRDKWMKRTMNNQHLGSDFHTYTLTWKNDSISIAVDGNTYWYFDPTFKNEAMQSNILDADNWIQQGGLMAPFDKEFYISLGVAVGGVFDFPDQSLNGPASIVKPWRNTDPKSELQFWMNRNSWYPTWNGLDAAMQIDYVRVWAV